MGIAELWNVFSLPSFLSALVIGLSIASIWLVAALGLTIIYGTMGVINMAHGELIMLGAYTTYVLQQFLGVPFILCLPLAFIVVALVGLAIERGLIRRLYDRPLDTLLATWGLALILAQGVRLVFGGDPKYVALPGWLNFQIEFAFVHLSGLRFFIIVMAVFLVAATWYVMYRTRLGIQVRAVMQDREMASSFGVDAGRVYSITFAFGAGLAGIAGAMFASLRTLFPNMGAGYIVEAFLVVVVGGVQLAGSVLSAVVLGEASSVLSYFTNDSLARFYLFVLIVIFLRFRPQGLLGEGGVRR